MIVFLIAMTSSVTERTWVECVTQDFIAMADHDFLTPNTALRITFR